MSTVTISHFAKAPLSLKKYARNTGSPLAEFQNKVAERMGYAAFVRNRQLCSFGGQVWSGAASAVPTSAAGTRSRWRFQFHSDPYARYIRLRWGLMRQDNLSATDCYARLRLYSDATMSTLVGEAAYHYGSTDQAPSDVPSEIGSVLSAVRDPNDSNVIIEIDPDTDYWCEFADVNYGRLAFASVWEFAKAPDTDNGYPSNAHGAGSPVYDEHRRQVAEMGRALHRNGGPMLWCYSSDTDATARTLASGSVRNLIDDSSTTYTYADPGATFALTNHATIRQQAGSGVPVRMWVYADGAASDTGVVRLVDEDGTTKLTVTIDQAAAGWYEATGYLPATTAKYFLMYGGNASSLAVYAVSIYEFEHAALEVTADAADGVGNIRIKSFGGACISPPAYQAKSSLGTGTGDVIVAWPSHTTDDIGLLFVQTADESVSTPSGWTLIDSYSYSTWTRITAFWCRATSGAMSDVTVTDPGNHAIVTMLTFRGCAASGSPVDIYTGGSDNPGTTLTVAGTTTTVDGALIVTAASYAPAETTTTSGWTNSELMSITERVDEYYAPGGGVSSGGIAVATGAKAFAGPYGTTTATVSTSSKQAWISIALKSD